MKKSLHRLMSLSLLSLLLITHTGQNAYAQDVAVSYQTFYDNLAPYGQWVNDPQYGDVWVPNEEGDFRPYASHGHWVMTDYGNTWVSEDPWGWACYHYGRWTYEPYYGWVWLPGYEWAPAWVNWRYGNGYCGWAPLGPGDGGYNCPDSWWVFEGPQYMYRPDCYRYRTEPEYNYTYIGQTTIINNNFEDRGTHVHYNYGPRREDVEQDTHQRIQVYSLAQSNRPEAPSLSGERLSMYRPAVNRDSREEARPANVMQASHPMGAPQPATNITSNRPPAFRQEMQQRQGQGNPGNNQYGQRPGNMNNNQPQPGNRQPPNNQPPVNREQPQQNTQPVNREPQQQREQPQQQHEQPMQQQQQHNFQAPPRPQGQQPPANNQRPAQQQRQGPGAQHAAPQQHKEEHH